MTKSKGNTEHLSGMKQLRVKFLWFFWDRHRRFDGCKHRRRGIGGVQGGKKTSKHREKQQKRKTQGEKSAKREKHERKKAPKEKDKEKKAYDKKKKA